MIKTLAIETSCDDTSVGIVSFDGKKFEVEKLLAYSQIDDHQKYGGVVPEVASRLHSEKVIKVIEGIGWNNIEKVDFISVTTHPGLPGSLVVGKAVGSVISEQFNKPLVSVNHISGHIFSLLLERNIDDIKYPMVVLTASGGHNDLYLIKKNKSGKFGGYEIDKLGGTLDDAAGECFDKVARMLGGPYPGGQWISEKALLGKKEKNKKVDIEFKRIFLSKDKLEFSFSGMKSQVYNLLQKLERNKINLTDKLICIIAYEFQEAVVEVLVKKLIKAGDQNGALTLGIAGGVSCNERLREYLNEELKVYNKKTNKSVVSIRPVKKVYSTDNAAMIGVVGILEK